MKKRLFLNSFMLLVLILGCRKGQTYLPRSINDAQQEKVLISTYNYEQEVVDTTQTPLKIREVWTSYLLSPKNKYGLKTMENIISFNILFEDSKHIEYYRININEMLRSRDSIYNVFGGVPFLNVYFTNQQPPDTLELIFYQNENVLNATHIDTLNTIKFYKSVN
ncbi:MAG: hypothetical protein Q4G27_05930 [Flavobacteriaceae bacterium]|nr:hypothetical protein [Flavobacteriaceae bacterium]